MEQLRRNWVGWKYHTNSLIPIATDLLAAPQKLMKIISCNCKKDAWARVVGADKQECHVLQCVRNVWELYDVHRWHTTTTLTKCVVVWCCGCCFEYPQQHILTKCVVVWCCGCCFEYPQQHILTKCVVVWCCGCSKQHPQHHTTTHFVKMCCCGYSKQHPQHHTTTHFVKMLMVLLCVTYEPS